MYWWRLQTQNCWYSAKVWECLFQYSHKYMTVERESAVRMDQVESVLTCRSRRMQYEDRVVFGLVAGLGIGVSGLNQIIRGIEQVSQ